MTFSEGIYKTKGENKLIGENRRRRFKKHWENNFQ